MRIKWTVRNGVLGTCRMGRTGDLRDFRPAQEVPIPVDAPDWEVFGAECHGSPKNVARFLGKEMADVFVSNPGCTATYLGKFDRQVQAWLKKHYGCALRLVHHDQDLDELFAEGYDNVKWKE